MVSSRKRKEQKTMKEEKADRTLPNPKMKVLYLAFELSEKEWKLGFSIGLGQSPRIRTISSRDLSSLQAEIQRAKQRFDLPEETLVLSCYEAGCDGFWLHRYLETQGIRNQVVDSASIEVNRRARRTKTDRLDVSKLLGMRIRYHLGDEKVWRIVHVPAIEAEDNRQWHREWHTLKSERTRHINRIKGLLASQGVRLSVKADFLERMARVRLWNGDPLPTKLKSRLVREYHRMQFVETQLKELQALRRERLRNSPEPCIQQVRQLMLLRGIGINSAWLFVMEFFAWRNFQNRREVGALAGLAPTHYQSGDEHQELGISKAGSHYVRPMAVEIAWAWLRFQPDSKLSRWYQTRFGQGNKRMRRIGIVALARRLLVALWRYLETGIPPEGAVLQT
jgi:transposase